MLLIRFQLFLPRLTSSTTILCALPEADWRREKQPRPQLPDGRICRRVVCRETPVPGNVQRKDDRSPCALHPTDSS